MKSQTVKPTHTPTPWIVTIHQSPTGLTAPRASLHNENHELVAHMSPANAAFICRAVNAHEELLAIVKRCARLTIDNLPQLTIEGLIVDARDIIWKR